MNQARIIYHIARADFLERIRRYSFLVMLGAVVFLGYQVAIGNVSVQLGDYRGEINSAWVGSMMALIASFFLGWFGFFLIKGSIARDRETGVGQIMAATPLTRPVYLLGKWVSNFAVLIFMVFVLAILAIVIQLFAGESSQFGIVALLAPFIFVALPMLALTAAFAVLFECIGFLQGGFGNIVYFFLFGLILSFAISFGKTNPLLDPLGFHYLKESMGEAAKAAFPNYDGSFVLGATDTPILGTFPWSGVVWTYNIVLSRFTFIGLGILIALASAFLFDRFDASRRKPRQTKAAASLPAPEVFTATRTLTAVHLTPLNTTQNRFVFARILFLELKLLLKGMPWWWFAGAGGLFIASLANTPENVRAFVLPITWLWPILIWSSLGNREMRHNVGQMVFSSASPLMRQLPATWFAGFTITALTGGGAAINFLSVADSSSLLVWFSAALFIPTFALALGVWSHSQKLFEVLYVSMWYLALNEVHAVDYLGANSNGNIGFFIPLSLALMVIAFIGRARQLQN
ncbi:MAG: ABC transporter permease subunit [Candidatus Promineifilaceae bacterium]